MVYDLVVFENIEDKILGIYIIRQHTLSYNSLSDKCYWETPTIEIQNLQAQESIFINALCSRQIKLKCMNDNNKKGIYNNMIVING